MTTLKNTESTWYLSKLAKATDTTYVYVTNLVRKLEKDGYLIIEHTGKKRIVKLTEKGLLVANAIDDLSKRLASV
jgi:predicted transcriptional regulator